MAETTTPKRVKDRQIQTLKLEAYDDVLSVRDRLRSVETRRVLLIFPTNAPILTRKIDLLLIQREAARHRLQLALLCTHPDIAEHAASLNLSCFYSVRQARSRPWKKGRAKVFAAGYDRLHPYELIGVASRLKPAPTSAQQRRRRIVQFLVASVVFLILLGLVLAVIPSANVRVTPAADAIQEPMTITTDATLTQIDLVNAVVPAQSVRLLVNGDAITIESTGRREGTDSLAQGRVIFANLTTNPLFIPKGTVVSTADFPPARFQTLQDVPLAGQVDATGEAEIIALADTQGLNGNVIADAIVRVEGELETLLRVRNPAPTFGGGIVELAIVTQEDHARLVTLARQSVLQNARTEFLLQLPTDDKFLVPDSVHIIEERPEWFTYSAQVGDPAESVNLTMRAVVEALIVDQLHVRQLALLTLSQRLPVGREINEAALTYRREGGSLDAQGRYQFQLFVEGSLPFSINPDLVAEQLNGQRISQARQILEREWVLDPRYPPEIRVYPFDWGFMPLLPVRIHVEVVER